MNRPDESGSAELLDTTAPPRPALSTGAPVPVGPVVLRWALSPLDFRAHAVDRFGDHKLVFTALCGHLLLLGDLHEKPPGGLCVDCSQAVMVRRTGGRTGHWVRSADDRRCHAVEPDQVDHVTTSGEGVTRCGQRLLRDGLQPDQQLWSPLCSRCVVGFARDLAAPVI